MHNETSVASANKLLRPMKLPVSWQPKKFSEGLLGLFVFLQKVHTKTLLKLNLIISYTCLATYLQLGGLNSVVLMPSINNMNLPMFI